MIIAHLIKNLPSLRSCSLTCYSWYIAAVPHLHLTLRARTYSVGRKFEWPNPVRYMHMLGLLPFVKTVEICGISKTFSPKLLNRRILPQFLALTNVQSLEIYNLDIPGFMPRIRQCFGPFLPTVRSLHLVGPKGSPRQIIFFIGLFRHLENLSLGYQRFYKEEPEDDLTLIPPFAPPLQGHLRVRHWAKAGFFQDMIRLFGEIRFGSMDLLNANETRLLLRACTKTLRVLQLHPTDPLGEQLYLKYVRVWSNNLVAASSLQDFDLSQNKHLRSLNILVCYIDEALWRTSLDTASRLFKFLLSTVNSPAFSQVTALYRGVDFHTITSRFPSAGTRFNPWTSHHLQAEEASRHSQRLQLLREITRGARNFRLVLHVDVQETVGEYVVQMLRKAVAAEKASGGFDTLFPEPLVTHTFFQIEPDRW